MSKRASVWWSAGARADLLAVVDYISDDNPLAAQQLKDEIEAKVGDLSAHPMKYPPSRRAPGYRQLTVRRNYLVFYRLLDEQGRQVVEVAAVVHARRQWPAS